MIYRKQAGYDKFKCIADKCPKSCCIGWQIMIDEDSLENYKNHDGVFTDRFKSSVDYAEECFYQHDTRCNMLNDNGLCDLQSTLGEDFLCDTCRLYPRHIEEYQDLREHLLSLSCPEVTRMVISPDYDFEMLETKDASFDDAEDFEDYDFLLFDQLEFAREKMIEVACAKSIPLQERMSMVASMAFELQVLFDEGDVLIMSDLECDKVKDFGETGIRPDYDYMIKSLDVLIGMEVLETSWTDKTIETRDYWKKHDVNSNEWNEFLNPDSYTEFVFEKIFKSLLYSYFCGSVYDGEIYARAMIAVISTRWIMMILKATGEDLAKTIYLYSREVEHSDDNVNTMIAYFEEELEQ